MSGPADLDEASSGGADPCRGRKTNARRVFSRIAGGYDALNRVMTLGVDVVWRRRALRILSGCAARAFCGGPPQSIIDVAAGTADFALGAARRFPGARVVGVDVTPEMLDVGRRKGARAGLSGRVSLMEGDAQRLPFTDGAFDCATCAFGFRNFPDRPRALAEARRVLRPGGLLLVLELFRLESRILSSFTSSWLRVVTALAARGAKAEYAYLRESMRRTASAAEFAEEARVAGFACERSVLFLPACRCMCFKVADEGRMA